MQKNINGAMLKSMILTAAKLLEINRVNIDALNVFPVPDGDTGTNMTMNQNAVDTVVNTLNQVIDAVNELKGAKNE